MARCRFTNGDIHRIPISDGDWIEVKKDLNTGDQKKLEAAGSGIPIKLADGTVHTPIDWGVYEIERAAIFLTDWSLRGADDKPMPLKLKDGTVSIDAIKALNPPDFEEINRAIFDYVMARAKEKNELRAAQEKKDVLPEPELTSQS